MTMHYPIAIIGGGLGGLTAARVLHANGINSVVFELEPNRGARVQGGMLDIHDYNGQKAIHAAGLWEPFTKIIHPGGESARVLDHTGAVQTEEPDDGTLSRPEVDRGDLRTLLLDSLPEDTIRWGHMVAAVRPVEGTVGRHEVEFANGEKITTDLLIGADGAWSKVRPVVTVEAPFYVGISFIEADLFNGAVDHPAEAAAMGPGMLFAFKDDTGMLGHLETDGTLHVYLGVRVDESWADSIDFGNTDAAKRAVLALIEGWDKGLRGLIGNADTPLIPRRIDALPVGINWARSPGVMLLGDAAHLMSPFAGEGANLAMYDGSELALAIAAHPGDTEAALAAYEAALFPRSQAAAAESAKMLEMLFQPGSPKQLVEFFHSMRPGSLETDAPEAH
ncbi:FAD-dependent oxidoreductase [Frondihabitans australicus]|uniref:Flavin-dependent monooxygenase n=1 Tax=Frondihabitans australicus TaxID=386892 RepID=A0A495IJ93_9MICO|nr:NAD(P)/FAD-dependent oxidoreductase [Frondihabitans australicus]RKR75849.1 2-polyprenyl-6-methoxyphenol hydroxylase-like FAD-dependent oxidoreductase [Frondihabitans australicus]